MLIAYDGEALRHYINGGLVCTCTGGSGKPLGPGSALELCGWMGGFYFAGLLDEFRIYDVGLTEAEVQALYSGQ